MNQNFPTVRELRRVETSMLNQDIQSTDPSVGATNQINIL